MQISLLLLLINLMYPCWLKVFLFYFLMEKKKKQSKIHFVERNLASKKVYKQQDKLHKLETCTQLRLIPSSLIKSLCLWGETVWGYIGGQKGLKVRWIGVESRNRSWSKDQTILKHSTNNWGIISADLLSSSLACVYFNSGSEHTWPFTISQFACVQSIIIHVGHLIFT